MALVLCTGSNPEAMLARRELLQKAGHRVVTAVNEKELSEACKQHQFEVVVIGQALSKSMKQHIVDLIRQHCPDTKVLEPTRLRWAARLKMPIHGLQRRPTCLKKACRENLQSAWRACQSQLIRLFAARSGNH